MSEKEQTEFVDPLAVAMGLVPPKVKGFWAKLNQWFLVKTLVKYHIIPGDNYWRSSALVVWYQLHKINRIIRSGKAKSVDPRSLDNKTEK